MERRPSDDEILTVVGVVLFVLLLMLFAFDSPLPPPGWIDPY